MPVRIQMILTVFVVAGAFGTEPEFQIRILITGPAADRAFVFCDHILPYRCLTHTPPELLLARPRLGRAECTVSVCDKKDKKV